MEPQGTGWTFRLTAVLPRVSAHLSNTPLTRCCPLPSRAVRWLWANLPAGTLRSSDEEAGSETPGRQSCACQPKAGSVLVTECWPSQGKRRTGEWDMF